MRWRRETDELALEVSVRSGATIGMGHPRSLTPILDANDEYRPLSPAVQHVRPGWILLAEVTPSFCNRRI